MFPLKSPPGAGGGKGGADTSSDLDVSLGSDPGHESGIHPLTTPEGGSDSTEEDVRGRETPPEADGALLSSPPDAAPKRKRGEDLEATRLLSSFDRFLEEEAAERTSFLRLHPRLRALSQLTDHMSPVGNPPQQPDLEGGGLQRPLPDIATSSPIPPAGDGASFKLPPGEGSSFGDGGRPPRAGAASEGPSGRPKPDFSHHTFKVPLRSRSSSRASAQRTSTGATQDLSAVSLGGAEKPSKRRNLRRTPLQAIGNVMRSLPSPPFVTPKRRTTDSFRDEK